MGLPPVTLRLPAVRSANVPAAMLHALGLGALAVGTERAYVDLAAALLADRARVARLRRALRELMRQSALMDGAGFARTMDGAFRVMARAR